MKPYISIVVVARNDNYGGDYTTRVQTFVRALDRQARLYPGLFELVLVEWNPPSNRPSMRDAMEWPTSFGLLIVTVAGETHRELVKGSSMPLLEYFGKNVGIRQARGEYVLVTNPDILFSEELMTELATRRLKQDCFYRTDRYDYDGSLVESVATSDLEAFASTRVLAAHIRHGKDWGEPISIQTPPGFQRVDWPKSALLPGDRLQREGTIIECYSEEGCMWGLHTNASGDFLLSSRTAWIAGNGFWERLDTHTHLDGFAVARLRSMGMQQLVFRNPLCILHMDHRRTEQKTRPSPPWSKVYSEFRTVLLSPAESPYSTQEHWGLEGVALATYCQEPSLKESILESQPHREHIKHDEKRDTQPESIAVPSDLDLQRSQLGRMLCLEEPVSEIELAGGMNALAEILAMKDILDCAQMDRSQLPRTVIPLLAIHIGLARNTGNGCLAEVLERLYGHLTNHPKN